MAGSTLRMHWTSREEQFDQESKKAKTIIDESFSYTRLDDLRELLDQRCGEETQYPREKPL